MTHEKLTHLDLFSGIGGFALAADKVWPGIQHVFCEIDPFCQEVLRKHWPEAEIYGDIRTLTADAERERKLQQKGSKQEKREWTGNINLLTGGFPCQPFSQAGRRRGEADDRFLWPEMCRVIGEFKPTWVIAENVRGLLTQGGGVVFERVCTDLEALGYEVQPLIIPAVAVGAPHRRDRVWIVAHARGARRRENSGTASGNEGSHEGRTTKNNHITCGEDTHTPPYTESERCKVARTSRGGRTGPSERSAWRDADWLEVATRLCRVDDGIPRRLDRNPRLKALGNAIVPAVAEEIMRAIRDTGV